ncbi:MAG TPA: hypothetical protein VHY91_02815 [Pirellulales bacterium]|nr:hypothetical protein [Pirellulales bacterium]
MDLNEALKDAIAVGGWIVAVLAFIRARKDSSQNALTEVLNPFVKGMGGLVDANHCRRTCEELRRAYPNPEAAAEAAQRIHEQTEKYGALIDAAREECRNFEREFANRHFRFPDRLNSLLKRARDDLFETGRLVNDGMFDRVDLQVAKLRDHHRAISAYARGWRLSDPIVRARGTLLAWRRKPVPEARRFELEPAEMDSINALVYKRATSQGTNSFVVHPPQMLIDRPEIRESSEVVDELENSVFEIVFQDGTYKMMSFVELMVFTYQLIMVKLAHDDAARLGAQVGKPLEVNISHSFSVEDIMRPEMAKMLLSKIHFSSSPSDAGD